MKNPTIFVIAMTLLFYTLVATACQFPIIQASLPTPPSGQIIELPFETIELRQPAKPDYWMNEKPGLLIIASSQEITQASQYITDDAIATLQKMDFLQSFALIAFNGLKPTLHDDFKIQKIIKNKDQIYVFVQPSQAGLQEVISSLYHLISIKKEGEWMKTFTFHLYTNNKESDISTVIMYIP